MRKVIFTAIIFLATAAILYGAAVVGPRVTRGGTLYDPVRLTTQNTTGLTDTLVTIFPDFTLDGRGTVLYLQNFGVADLQDLQILLTPTTDSTAEFDMQGKSGIDGTSPSVSMHQVGCIDALAAGGLCILTIEDGIPYGNLKIKAQAAAGTTTEIKIWVLDRR